MNNLKLTGIILLSILLVLSIFMFFFTQNNKIYKITYTTNASKVQALCPFYCIDQGYTGGYYTNLLNKCICKK